MVEPVPLHQVLQKMLKLCLPVLVNDDDLRQVVNGEQGAFRSMGKGTH